jgi:hypothetical protein
VIRCEFVDPLLEPRWDQWILEVPEATFFHSSLWARVLTETYNYPLHYAVLREAKDHRIRGILPVAEVRSWWTGRRGVCLPFSDECAPLVADPSALEPLVQAFRDLGRQQRWDYLELRGRAETVGDAIPCDEFWTHRIPMESSEELQFGRLKESHRRNIRKAQREGVEIHTFRTSDAIDAYYTLHCLTRRRHSLPPQPHRFFRLIHKHAIEPGYGFVALARFSGQWIAGAVYFQFGSKALYKYGASNPVFQHLRPNNLLMWQAILLFRAQGLQELSLGRTDLHSDGLLQFKRGWGGEENPMRYHRIELCRPLRPKTVADASRGVKGMLIKKLPVPLLRGIGALTYRHFG